MKDKSYEILTTPVATLPVSEPFKEIFFTAGFKSLNDALQFEGDILINDFGFTYHTITELITLLKQHGLEELFKD